MTLYAWAFEVAEQKLAESLPRRWAHVQGVAERARSLRPVAGEEADLLEAAALLHDVGYAPDLATTAFHPLDGAVFLRESGAPERLKPNTVRSVRTVISGLLGYAVRCGAITSNPTREVGQIEGDRKPARALTRDERIDLLAKLDADPVAVRHDIPDLVRFMLGTGCRIGEAIAVQDEAIDWEDATVSIEANIVRVKGVGLVRHDGKTFSARRVLPLPRFVVTRLADRQPSDAIPESMVFPNSRGHDQGRGSWRDPHNTGGRLRDALRRAGFEWVTSHVFRKTAATVLDEAKLTARAIAGHIGHARPSITQDVYMDKRAGSREAADILDEAYRSE